MMQSRPQPDWTTQPAPSQLARSQCQNHTKKSKRRFGVPVITWVRTGAMGKRLQQPQLENEGKPPLLDLIHDMLAVKPDCAIRATQ